MRNADPDARLAAAGRCERYGADAVEEQFAQQLRAGETAVADGVEESVADGFVLVFVVDDAEAVARRAYSEVSPTKSSCPSAAARNIAARACCAEWLVPDEAA